LGQAGVTRPSAYFPLQQAYYDEPIAPMLLTATTNNTSQTYSVTINNSVNINNTCAGKYCIVYMLFISGIVYRILVVDVDSVDTFKSRLDNY